MRSAYRGGCTVLAGSCIRIYFEGTQQQQAADARRYLSSIIYVFYTLFYLCLHLHLCRSLSSPLFALHKGARRRALTVMCTVAASTEELHECTQTQHNCLFPPKHCLSNTAYKRTQLEHTEKNIL